MASTFQGINMATEAMQAFNVQIDTIGNNIANMSTTGYSRQVVNFDELQPTQESYGTAYKVGNGVSVANVTAVRDLFLLERQLASNSTLANTNQQLAGNTSIQSVFNETGTSSTISDALTKFYNAWSSLSSDPGSSSGLIAVQQAGETLASDVQSAYSQLQQLQTQTAASTKSTITSIQNYANQIADLNQQIRETGSIQGSDNSLIDQRQQALQSLASLVNINTQTNADGSVNVTMNQFQLVNQSGAETFPTGFDAASSTVTDGTSTYNVTGGQLAGLLAQSTAVTSAMTSLDNVANSLRTQVNTLMASGTNGLGATGQNFFQDVTPPATQTGAVDFQVDPAVVANYKAIATGTSGNSGDGTLASEIAAAQTAKITTLGNQSISDYFTSTLSQIGTQVNSLTSAQSTQQALSTQISSQISSASGVSIDQEMSDLVKAQQSYQAAAKSLSMVDQNLQYLMSMMPS